MAVLNTFAPIGLPVGRSPRGAARGEITFRHRSRPGVAASICAPVAAVLACLWMVLALGFSLLVLVGLLVAWAS